MTQADMCHLMIYDDTAVDRFIILTRDDYVVHPAERRYVHINHMDTDTINGPDHTTSAHETSHLND